jgi:hypothetical protein
MFTNSPDPSPATGLKPALIICVLIGAVSIILALGVLLLRLQAEWAIRTYLERGVVLKAAVTEKYEKTNAGNRGGGFTTYTIGLRYSYFLKDGRVRTDLEEKNSSLFSVNKTETSNKTSDGVMKVSQYNLSRHVYYTSWSRVKPGDTIEIIVLPEDPERKVLLKSFADRKYPYPIMLRPWFGFLFFVIGITGLTLFRKLGGRF